MWIHFRESEPRYQGGYKLEGGCVVLGQDQVYKALTRTIKPDTRTLMQPKTMKKRVQIERMETQLDVGRLDFRGHS